MIPATDGAPEQGAEGQLKQPASPTQAYIDWLVKRCREDPADSARLRRTLRNDDTIDATAWWILGAWLPENHDKALIKVRVAGLYASHGDGPGIPWRNPGGEIGAADIGGSAAQRMLENVTAPGSSTVTRIGHLIRILPQCPQRGARIDWALLHDDLRLLASSRPDRHRSIRSRWYRQFHSSQPFDRKDNQ